MKNSELLDNELIEPEIERNTNWVSIVGYGCIYTLYLSIKLLLINFLYDKIQVSLADNTDIDLFAVVFLGILTVIISLIIIIISNSIELSRIIIWMRHKRKCLNNDISHVVIIIYLYHAMTYVFLSISLLLLQIESSITNVSTFSVLMFLIFTFIIAFIVIGKVNKRELELITTHESNR